MCIESRVIAIETTDLPVVSVIGLIEDIKGRRASNGDEEEKPAINHFEEPIPPLSIEIGNGLHCP